MPVTEALNQKQALAAERAVRDRNVNLPNLLTLSRILLIPVFVVLFSTPTANRSLAAALVFMIAAVTDMVDGYLARRRSEITNLGRLLDPIADKLLILSGLILLVQFQRVAAWVAILIIAREVAVTGIRAIAAAEGFSLPVETMGKYKMTAQVIAIVLLILGGVTPDAWNLQLIGTIILYVALALGLTSGGRHMVTFWQEIALRRLS